MPPPLEWTGAPSGTRSFVLVCEDPDAPRREDSDSPFVHWLLYNIPADATGLPEGPNGSVKADSGVTSFGQGGYGGPMPPQGDGPHHYHFRLYATDLAPGSLKPGSTRESLLAELDSRVLAVAELVGVYERKELLAA